MPLFNRVLKRKNFLYYHFLVLACSVLFLFYRRFFGDFTLPPLAFNSLLNPLILFLMLSLILYFYGSEEKEKGSLYAFSFLNSAFFFYLFYRFNLPVNLIITLFSLNLIYVSYNWGVLKSLVFACYTVCLYLMILSAKSLLWSSYSSFHFIFNVASFFIYSFSALSISEIYRENKGQVLQLKKKLSSELSIKEKIFESTDLSVFLFSSQGQLVDQNLKARELMSEKSFFAEELFSFKDSQVDLDSKNYKIRKSEVSLDGEKGFLFLVYDQTQEEKMRAELEQARKLSAVGTLSAGLAHEIRNPLAGISGSVELLKENLDDPQLSQKLFSTVLKEITRLNALVTDFLDFARPDVPHKKEIQAAEFLQSTVDLISLDPRTKGVEFVSSELEDAILMGDESKLKQVFINLLVNASQAFNEERLEELQQSNEKPRVVLKSRKMEKAYQILVQDNGMGIEKNQINKIFEPFHTTKDKGTGLGLALSHRILEVHGATLSVESEPKKGTTFAVEFKL